MGKKEEMTEIEKRWAERAEIEAKTETSPVERLIADEPLDANAPKEFAMFDERWEPSSRPLYDYEVIALINRDSGRYVQAGLMLDSVEDIDAFTSKQLEQYGQWMTDYQIGHYRMAFAGALFRLVLGSLLQQQMAAKVADNGAYNQIVQEITKPHEGKRSKNN